MEWLQEKDSMAVSNASKVDEHEQRGAGLRELIRHLNAATTRKELQ
jgi:hypothetical protein